MVSTEDVLISISLVSLPLDSNVNDEVMTSNSTWEWKQITTKPFPMTGGYQSYQCNLPLELTDPMFCIEKIKSYLKFQVWYSAVQHLWIWYL
jgi:hypothetical protein